MEEVERSIIIDWTTPTVGISGVTDNWAATISNKCNTNEQIFKEICEQVPKVEGVDPYGGEASFVIIQNINDLKDDEREKLIQNIFEDYNAYCLYFANSALMSLYAYGETSGLNVHLSSDAAFITPVYSSYTLKHGYIKCSLEELASNIEASIKKIDVGLRGKLLSKIFLSGDSANSDFAAEIAEKLKPVFEGYEVNVTAPGLKTPHMIGANNFSLTQQFYSMRAMRNEYDELGPSGICRVLA
jgi:actin-related protein